MRSVALLMLFAFALSGCIDSGNPLNEQAVPSDSREDSSKPMPEPEVLTGEIPPVWDIGNSWTYDSVQGNGFTLVVTDEVSDSWILDTSNESVAWGLARGLDTLAGKIQKNDLSIAHDGYDTVFFDFPLEDNKTWTTQWEGEELTISLVQTGPVFEFQAHSDDELVLTYDYDPEIGWFTKKTFFDEEEEIIDVLELVDHAQNWSGEVIRWDAENLFDARSHGTTGGTEGQFEVSGDFDELWARVFLSCENGEVLRYMYLISPLDLDGSDQLHMDEGTECDPFETVVIMNDPHPGTWRTLASWTALTGNQEFEFDVWLRSVNITEFS